MRELVKGERGRVYALFAIVMLASAFGNLSQTAVNAMMPEIMGEFALDVSLGQWLTTSYMLVLGIAVPAATFLGKRFTTRQHVFIALAFFLVGALADCLASNFAVLLAGRICQAVSTGLLLPLMQTIAMTRFPEGRRATAMGIAGIAMGFAPNIGPTVGGAFSFSFGWRSFFVLLLAGVVVLGVATALLVRGGEGNRSERFDTLSFMLSALGFGGLLLGFSEASSFALTSPFVWGPLLAVGSVLMVFLDEETPLAVTTFCQAVRAFGVSGLMGPLISWSLAGLPGRIVTDGSSFSIAGRQACASLGTSVMVLLIALAGTSAAAASNPALPYQLAFAFSAVFAVATFVGIVAKVR